MNFLLSTLLVVIFPFFFVGNVGDESSRSFNELWNLGHVVFFAVAALLAFRYFTRKDLTWRSIVWRILLFSAVLGGGIEIVQLGIPGSDSSWGDVCRDLAGAVIVLSWSELPVRGNLHNTLRNRFIAVAVLGFTCIPLGRALEDEYRIYKDFPMLSGLESNYELSRWSDAERMSLVQQPASQGRYAARILLPAAQYSGISLRYFHQDWRGKTALAFDIYNPGEPLTLHCRVHDNLHFGKNQQYQNRYNSTTFLGAGWNTIAINMEDISRGPVGRKMNLANIRGFGIFVMQQKEEKILFLDNVRLL